MRVPSSSVGKQSKLLFKPTEVELGLQVGVEFDKKEAVVDVLIPASGQHLPVIKVLVLHVQQVLQSWLEAEATQLSGPHFALIDYLDYFS